MYKLRYSPAVEAVWDALPDEARAELDGALVELCHDPFARPEPRGGERDDVARLLTLRHTVVSVVVITAPPVRRVYLRHIHHLGGTAPSS